MTPEAAGPAYVSHSERLRLALRRWDDPTHTPAHEHPPSPQGEPLAPLVADWQDALLDLAASTPVDLRAWDT